MVFPQLLIYVAKQGDMHIIDIASQTPQKGNVIFPQNETVFVPQIKGMLVFVLNSNKECCFSFKKKIEFASKREWCFP